MPRSPVMRVRIKAIEMPETAQGKRPGKGVVTHTIHGNGIGYRYRHPTFG